MIEVRVLNLQHPFHNSKCTANMWQTWSTAPNYFTYHSTHLQKCVFSLCLSRLKSRLTCSNNARKYSLPSKPNFIKAYDLKVHQRSILALDDNSGGDKNRWILSSNTCSVQILQIQHSASALVSFSFCQFILATQLLTHWRVFWKSCARNDSTFSQVQTEREEIS